jgi:hypothetical protein
MGGSFGAGWLPEESGGMPEQENKADGELDKRVGRVIMVGSSGSGNRFRQGGQENKVSREVDKRSWIGIIVQLNQGLTLGLFKNKIKIICVGACGEWFRLVLNSRHSN